jgi:hypothetical protein
MPRNNHLTYFNLNIAGLVAPRCSYMFLGGHIAELKLASSITDFIELKQKCVGLQLRRSMSRISFLNVKLKVLAMSKLTTGDLHLFENGKIMA